MYLYSEAEVTLINNSRDDALKEILYGVESLQVIYHCLLTML